MQQLLNDTQLQKQFKFITDCSGIWMPALSKSQFK